MRYTVAYNEYWERFIVMMDDDVDAAGGQVKTVDSGDLAADMSWTAVKAN